MKRQHFSLHYLSGGASGRPKVVEALAESSFVAFVSDDTPTIRNFKCRANEEDDW